MAHSTHIASLLQTLIKSTISGPRADEFKRVALTTIARAPNERTNQFDVDLKLAGLEEKARILNNDPLADAIRERLNELSSRSDKWVPEILSFLLELSDRPVRKFNLEELIQNRPLSPSAPLTWSDILEDDPLDDQETIWKDNDFRGGGSSDDDDFDLDLADDLEDSIGSKTFNDEPITPQVESLIEPYDHNALKDVTRTQFWKSSTRIITDPDLERKLDQPEMLLTELQAIREVVFMLLGLPTSIYTCDETGQIALSQRVALQHVSRESTAALLGSFAAIGGKLLTVRRWVGRTVDISLEQTFQASLASRLQKVDHDLSKVQEKLLHHCNKTSPSLLHLYDGFSSSSRLLQQATSILPSLTGAHKSKLPFKILEHLFDETCAKQTVGDLDGYEYMARIFFNCFNTYLRPVQLWIEQGLLDEGDGTMFIKKNQEVVSLNSLWHDQFHLVKDGSGDLHAPVFLHLAARKIFTSGKSVDLLRRLGFDHGLPLRQECDKQSMSFENVCEPASIESLSPFPVLFDMALNRWVTDIYHPLSSTLCERLTMDCGLQRSLDALELLYFCPSMPFSSKFTLAVFEKLDRGHRIHESRVTLTELIQNVFRPLSCIDVAQIEIHTRSTRSHREIQSAQRHMSVLETIDLHYILPWPIANIIRPRSIEIYRRVFVFLLQLQRAKHLLQRQTAEKHSSAVSPKSLLHQYAVRHRLLWFTNTMLTYFTHLVLLTNTARMRASMRIAVDVDEMIEIYDAYITRLENQCFMTKQHRPLHQAIISLLDLTIVYSDVVETFKREPTSKANALSGDLLRTRGQSSSRSTNSGSGADSSEESDSEAVAVEADPKTALAPPKKDKMHHVNDTISKLLMFLTAAVRGISKTDSAPCWEILADTLMAASR